MEVEYSQNGEQAHILHYLKTMGIEKGHLVDLGAGDGRTMSNTRALLDRGWTGDLFDGDPKGAKDVVKQWITKESIRVLVNCKCDFLNIDLDGNDYWLLEEVYENTPAMPKLIVCEINPIFDRNDAKVMPYNGAHVWKGDTYYGMSLAACEQLGARCGYQLAYLHAGINAFLVRNEYVDKHPELMRRIDYKVKRDHKSHDPSLPWLTLN